MNFDWGTDLITNEAADFVSIRWSGKVRIPFDGSAVPEDYILEIIADDGVRLYFDGVLVIDRWDTCCDVQQATVTVVPNSFYDIRLEYKEH